MSSLWVQRSLELDFLTGFCLGVFSIPLYLSHIIWQLLFSNIPSDPVLHAKKGKMHYMRRYIDFIYI